MPEKRPPPFDFKALKPNVPVEFTLLKKSFSGQSEKDGETFDWHGYPCSYAGNEIVVFTPSERVHAALQYLKVLPNTKFTITKGSDINLDTGKSFIFYEIKYGDQTIDTKNELTNGTEEGAVKDIPHIKEPPGLAGQSHVAQFERYYAPIMDAKLDYILSKIAPKVPDQAELLQTLWELDKSTSANVSTILIQNGGR